MTEGTNLRGEAPLTELAAVTAEDASVTEIDAPAKSGMLFLVVNTLLMLGAVGLLVWGVRLLVDEVFIGPWFIGLGALYSCLVGPIAYGGLKMLKPREALVLTLFGRYFGTLVGPGFFWVNPFVSAVQPAARDSVSAQINSETASTAEQTTISALGLGKSKVLSLKVLTLNNDKQKINDLLGNPIIIGIAVIWKVVNTAKAVFNVDNYSEYLSIQCDAALRGIVRMYPYDKSGDGDTEKSLRGSSEEISDRLKEEIQSKVAMAGLEILEARITHLSYAQEIAAAMLQRQQASAVIDARQMIVEGAVSMVEMALEKLSEKQIVSLDEERKASMVSNLLVVLCSNKDTQPVINSGSIY